MVVIRRRGWEISEARATPKDVYFKRRELLASMGLGTIALMSGKSARLAAAEGPYPVPRNEAYVIERAITDPEIVKTYNNFYEFGSHKQIWRAAQRLETDPWKVTIDGMVDEEMTLDVDDLLRRMPLEERLYRHRCVEAWSMTVPWSGFPLASLVELARPLASATYVRMETFEDPSVAPGQRQFWYPWPYVEGLTLPEAKNELAFIATGLYGEPMPKQNGAPLRLVVPWKYGFKSIKSIVRLTFTDERPVSFWEDIQASEYGFWANVNPEVPHPRWSQATERVLGTDERVPTQLFNGYGDYVAHLYQGMEDERLFI